MQVGQVPLIGRAADLAALENDLAVIADAGRAVVISGDAGMGKTRLLREFTARLDDAVVLRGGCVDSGPGPAPLAAIADLVRAAVEAFGADEVREAAGRGADILGVLVPSLGGGVDGAERLADVVVELLSALSRGRRLVIVVEDLHWADGTTLEIVGRLVRRAATLPVLIVLTYRTDDVGRGHPLRPLLAELERGRLVAHRPLSRLTDAEAGALAAAIGGETVASEVLRDIAARSEGIPFYVEELASFSGDRLPTSLRDVLLLRYEALDAATRAFARVLATGGVAVPHAVMREVLGGEDLAFETAVRAGVDAQVIVVHDEDYAFRHALMREAVYAELLPTERLRLHAAYAAALEAVAPTPRVLADIAHHWWAARVPDRALAAAVNAQRAASRASAWSTAAEAGERALELWETVADPVAVSGLTWVELLRRTAAVLVSANRHERALAFAREAVAAWPEGDQAGLASMLGQLATVELQSGTADGLESIGRALAILGDGSEHDLLRADLLLSSARVHMLNRRPVLGWDVAMAAKATAEPFAQAGDQGAAEIVAQALLIAATCRTASGDADAVELFEEARQRSAGFVRAMMRYYINYSNTLMLVGRYDEAAALAREGVEYGREHFADRGPLLMTEANVIEAMMYGGRLREAERMGEQLAPLIEAGLFSAFLRERLLCLAVWRGRLEEAEEALADVLHELAPFGVYEYQTRLGLAYDLGELALARGDARSALEHASAARESAAEGDAPLDLPLAAIAARAVALLRAQGSGEGTEAELEPFRAIIDRLTGWPIAPLWSAVFAAELGEGPWSAAVECVGPAYIRAYAMVRDGQSLVEAADRAAAQQRLQAACAFAEEIGADYLAEQARRLLSDAGLSGGRADPILTSREEQVLGLVAEGLSNGQIADRLYISAKTVSVHVSAILRKLGASSRTEAAAIHARRVA
ncbi:ATP-binding protein [Microbacterium sp. E-13]|uniref:ATP-binding protein n=1 Tax=Microbacterium sp. E-13 TaxID=3404048 RepID=UPI003CE71950